MAISPGYSSNKAGGGSGGGGNANIGVLLRQAGEDDKGLFIAHSDGDLTWHAQAEERTENDEPAVGASLAFANQDQDAVLNVELPTDWVARPETVNIRDIVYDHRALPTTGTKAEYDYGRLKIQAAIVGAIGNRYRVRVLHGSAATESANAHADINLWAGTPGLVRGGTIRVTSPNSVEPALRASSLFRFGSRNNGAILMRIQWHEGSTAGNGFQLNFQVSRNDGGSEQTVATYAADNRSMTVVITGTAARRNEYQWSEAIAAINGARTSEGNQLVVADVPGGSSTSTNFLNMPADGSTQSMQDAGNALPDTITLSGGQAQSGTATEVGTATNRGGIKVVAGDPSLPLGGASAVINVAPPGDTAVRIRLTYTGTSRGAAGNSRVANVQFDSSIPSNTVSITADHSDGDIAIDFGAGTVAIATILTALTGNVAREGGGSSGFFVSAQVIENAGSATTVTWGSTDSAHSTARFSGGQDAGAQPLTAVWDAGAHLLTITALATHTANEVITAITALNEFNTTSGQPGFVVLHGAAVGGNVIAVDGTVGNALDYDFASGTDAVARSTLTLRETFTGRDPNSNQQFYSLEISGVLNTDTIGDVIDAYTGSQFTLSPASGSSRADTVTGIALAWTTLVGGVDAIARAEPVVTLTDTGHITISLYAADDSALNTTLFELANAWIRTTYNDAEGTNTTFGSSGVSVDVTSGGAATDPLRNQALPVRPTGGRNFVAAGPIEILSRPDDEVDGPNILLRFKPSADTMQDVLDGFIAMNNGGFSFTMVYGTDPTAHPEAVPFNRSFFDGGAEAPTVGTGGLSLAQVDARIRVGVKGYARAGGPSVPDSEIPAIEARDAEVPGLLKDALVAGTPDHDAFDDELPFLDSDGDWKKANSQSWRSLFKPSLGEWGDLNGLFVFRVGDIVPHTGGLYYCLMQHTKNSQTGPDGDARWLPFRLFWGNWTARFYPAGTQTLHRQDLWLATAGASSADEPGVSNSWLQITNRASVKSGGNWSASASYKDETLLYHTNPAGAWYLTLSTVAAGIEPGVAGNWASFYRRIGWQEGSPSSLVNLQVTGNRVRLTARDGTHHDETIPSGGTEVEANPAGSGGTPLASIDIAGTRYLVGDTEVPVGSALILGRITSTVGKRPSDLPDHTDPLRVPLPVEATQTDTDIIAEGTNWPVVPLLSVAADGGFLSSLDTTANSIEVAEGMYIIGTRIQNVWVDARIGANQGPLSGNAGGNLNTNQRLSVEMLIERWDGTNWVELSKSLSPYGRHAPHAGNRAYSATYVPVAGTAPGEVDNTTDNNPAYNGDFSPVSATLYSVIVVPPGGAEIRFRMERGDTLAPSDIARYDEASGRFVSQGTKTFDDGYIPWGYFCDVPQIGFFPLGRPTQTQPITPRPHINSFILTSGDQTPQAGDLGGTQYSYSYAIAQGSHAGAARIIGFKGDTKPSGSATVLATLTDLNHGSGSVSIPTNTMVAEGEEYRLRLQVFGEGVTPGVDTVPVSYQDLVIEAHAAATAAYHVGYLAYDANDADAAAAAARITAFTNDTATSPTLPSEMTVALPNDSMEYQLYLLAKSDEAQPTGFTSQGQNASGSFYAAQDVTISSVTYKAYILKPLFRLTSTDNGTTIGVTG